MSYGIFVTHFFVRVTWCKRGDDKGLDTLDANQSLLPAKIVAEFFFDGFMGGSSNESIFILFFFSPPLPDAFSK